MSEVTVRSSNEEDLPAITAIYRHHVLHGTASFEVEAPTLETMVERWQALVGGGFPYLVAATENDVVGFAYAGPYRLRPAYRFTVENAIYLTPRCIGRGVGRRLLDVLIGECETRGYRQMIAVIGDSANVASVRLHAGCGFTHVGTLRSVGFKHGRWLDSVLMQRPVGQGNATPP